MKASSLTVGGSSQGYPHAPTALRGGFLDLLALLRSARAERLRVVKARQDRKAAKRLLSASGRIERGHGGELPDPRLAESAHFRYQAGGCGTDFRR